MEIYYTIFRHQQSYRSTEFNSKALIVEVGRKKYYPIALHKDKYGVISMMFIEKHQHYIYTIGYRPRQIVLMAHYHINGDHFIITRNYLIKLGYFTVNREGIYSVMYDSYKNCIIMSAEYHGSYLSCYFIDTHQWNHQVCDDSYILRGFNKYGHLITHTRIIKFARQLKVWSTLPKVLINIIELYIGDNEVMLPYFGDRIEKRKEILIHHFPDVLIDIIESYL